MGPTEKQRYLDFLEAKVEIVADDPPKRAYFEGIVARLYEPNVQSLAQFRDVEDFIDAIIRPDDPEERREFDRQFIERFGFARIGTDPTSISRRVLKRGHIMTLEELEVVRNLIANQGNIESLGAETYDQLALLLDTKEAEGME